MNLHEQMPALLVLTPLSAALLMNLLGFFRRGLCYPLTVATTGVGVFLSLDILGRVTSGGAVDYRMGGWLPPFGIEFVIDQMNALVLTVTTVTAFVVAVFSREPVRRELPGKKTPLFYTLFLLSLTGLLGMTVTGDAFNLYVLVEMAALSSYALVAMGGGEGPRAGFNYLLLGTIGASFFLLGVGHLYISTGSLNMADLRGLIEPLGTSRAVFVGFILVLLGLWIKMAFFPFHGWLPNAYVHAPTAAGCFMAPLVTKVTIYVMFRMMFSVFSAEYVFGVLSIKGLVVWLAVLAIAGGSFLALAQKNLKSMLSYLIVAEVGYMVGGVWLANTNGITGAVLHILNDALMTLCLFLAVGIIVYKTHGHGFDNVRALYRKMPITMAAFTAGALSMIGVPPTAGFFSKWYLILGGIEAGQWAFVGALVLSSLINAVLFFKIIEIGYFEPYVDHHHVQDPLEPIDEAPLSMLAPLVATAVSLVVVGLNTGRIVTTVVRHAVPAGL